MTQQMLMASIILIPVIFGILIYLLPLKMAKIVLLGVQVYLLALAVFLYLQTGTQTEIYAIIGGDNPILNIVFRGDRFSTLLVVLTNFLFGIGFLYKLNDKFFSNKLILLYLILQGLTNGLFLSDDFFNLFILFEVSTVITTILLMYKRDGRVVYDALYYLITQMVSMMFFLFGIGFLYRAFGVLSISYIASMIQYAPASEMILPFSFLMAGLGFKLGLYPMQGWVSRAYALNSAPITQVAVMSSIMMKTTLYWFLFFHRMFLPLFDYSLLFSFIAIVTAIYSALKALSQKDIRLMLAFSTVSQIGFMLAASLVGNVYSETGTLYHFITHAIFKMLLFLSAGLIISQYETADIYSIRGVMKKLPFAGVMTIIGMISITGFPLTSGSVSKYFMTSGLSNIWLEIIFWIMSFGTILVFVKFSTMLLPSEHEKEYSVKKIKKVAVTLLSLATLCIGALLNYGINNILLVDFHIKLVDFITKGLIYFVLVALAIIIYRKFIHSKQYHYDKMEHSLSFSRMCLVLVAFFTVLVSYGMWVVR